jgi:aspartate/methionine/tyrosine aminotransferase
MNKLAQELNAVLEGTAASRLLSQYGKRAYFPKGIVAQTGEARRRAHRYNATAGMAFHEGQPLALPSIRDVVPELSPSELVEYSTSAGDPEIRELWKKQMLAKNPSLDGTVTSLPLVTSGLTHGLSLTAELFANPGDVVIIPDLYWGNYRLIFEVRQDCRIVTFPFFSKAGKLNLPGLGQVLRAQETAGKAIVLLNFPNNPTGYSPDRDEAQAIVEVIGDAADRGNNILAVTDDAYFGLFYEEDTFRESLFGYLASVHENVLALKVDGSTKEDMVWGFRIGFLTYAGKGMSAAQCEALERKTMGAIRASISMASRPAQSLLVRAYRNPAYESEKRAAVQLIEEKYRKVRSILAEGKVPDSLEPLPFNSGYFMCFRLRRGNAEELRQALLDDGVGTISVSDDLLRIAFSSVDPAQMEGLFEAIFARAARL